MPFWPFVAIETTVSKAASCTGWAVLCTLPLSLRSESCTLRKAVEPRLSRVRLVSLNLFINSARVLDRIIRRKKMLATETSK